MLPADTKQKMNMFCQTTYPELSNKLPVDAAVCYLTTLEGMRVEQSIAFAPIESQWC